MRRSIFVLAITAAALVSPGLSAQTITNPNERIAPPRTNPQDREDVWTLHMKFKDPRTITIDTPGQGPKTYWYMWYEVTNRTGAPRFFHPTFELVTLDRNTVHVDQVLPAVQDAIVKQEDPTGRLVVHNSVTIGKEPIPAAKPDAYAPPVYGVAIWPDVATRAADTTRFSVFVSGLSNGWSIDDANVLRRKTLQLNFKRYADSQHQDGADVRFVTPTEYVYRSTSVQAPERPKPPALAPVDK